MCVEMLASQALLHAGALRERQQRAVAESRASLMQSAMVQGRLEEARWTTQEERARCSQLREERAAMTRKLEEVMEELERERQEKEDVTRRLVQAQQHALQRRASLSFV